MSQRFWKSAWSKSLILWTIILAAGWTGLMSVLLAWDCHETREQAVSLAAVDARASYERDVAFRRWAARHGGVYVPIDAETPPNPLLAHVEERDITTPLGRQLTLMNSAYISRQIHEYESPIGTRARVTSLKPIRPQNAPDAWEAAALAAVEQGEPEVTAEQTIDGRKYLRHMQPMNVEPECLKCHAAQGYQLGDIRGGISVAVPMDTYEAAAAARTRFAQQAYGGLWLLGLGGIAIATWALARRARAQQAANQALLAAEQERVHLTEQLLQSQKLESVGRLAGGVAHDINNMLSPVMGYSDLLLAGCPPKHPDRVKLEGIYEAAQRARTLTHQLLAFARKQRLELRSLDLNATVTGFERMLRHILRDDVRLEIRLGRDLEPMRGDPGQIEQVLLNLVVNAQDAMPSEGHILIETAAVWFDAADAARHPDWTPGSYLRLSVRDTGEGMESATAQRVFEPFFTTKAPGKGTGLGLSTVYGIVRQHNGYIDVQSEPGKGTVFNIYWPVIADALPVGGPDLS